MTTWKPGQLAMLTLRTGVEKPALRVEPAGEEGWVWHLLGEEFPGLAESGVTAARPLVVIDPEDRVTAERLARDNYDRIWQPGIFDALTQRSQAMLTDFMQAALRCLAEGATT